MNCQNMDDHNTFGFGMLRDVIAQSLENLKGGTGEETQKITIIESNMRIGEWFISRMGLEPWKRKIFLA